MNNITIVDFKPEHQSFFESLNRNWIEKYFTMEEMDNYILGNPEEAIIKPGGAILVALYNGEVAGCVALRKAGDNEYEFTKMAVAENYRRKRIAEELSYASFKKASELGAKQLFLFSNSILKPAIALYEKLGFRHVQLEDVKYKRSNVKMSIDIDILMEKRILLTAK
jgi:N-acetylglutamate synthase-like GNAT family acetyltransferase